MNFIITNKSQLKNVLTLFYSKYKENERYNLSFDVIKKEVSKKQRGFIFGGLCKVLRAFFYETQGELYEISDIKEMLYRKAGVYEEKILTDGSSFYKYKGLSQMTEHKRRSGRQNKSPKRAVKLPTILPSAKLFPDLPSH